MTGNKKPPEKVAKIWWPLLDLNQRPSDYENHFESIEISNLLIFIGISSRKLLTTF
jgi:hypothetical protein